MRPDETEWEATLDELADATVHACPRCGARLGRAAELSLTEEDAEATVSSTDPQTQGACSATERRIRNTGDPPASDLVPIDRIHRARPARSIRLHRAAYDAYRQLKAAAESAGIPSRLLTIVSGYRTSAEQRVLWERALRKHHTKDVARKWVAPPGESPHQSGRAVDFWLGTANDSRNVRALRRSPAYAWLVCNAARFGFFPYAREPWHWEHNPPSQAAG